MPTPDDIPYVRQVKQVTSIDEISDIPVIGGLYNAGNTVIDYFESGCHPDWYVYAETLFPALGEAVLVLLSFGLDDVLRGYLRPAGGRGFGGLGRASRRTRKPTRAQRVRGKLSGGIPEIGELLGKNLPGAQVIRARQVSGAERFLWKVDGLAQRGLWYWMIADIADDFTVNWTTALYSSVECEGDDVGGCVQHDNAIATFGASPFVHFPLDTETDHWGAATCSGGAFRSPVGTYGSLSFTGTFEQSIPPATGGALAIRDVDAGFATTYGYAPKFNPATGMWEVSVTVHTIGGHNYQVGCKTDGGGKIWRDLDATFVCSAGVL